MQQVYSAASPTAESQASLPLLTGRAYMVIGVFDDADMVIVCIEALDMCRQDINVELATLQWVSWFNHHRLHEPIGYIPPAEAEGNYQNQSYSHCGLT